MWKYVGQRLKDTTDLTCTHLKNLRSTYATCKAKTKPKPDDPTKDAYKLYNDGRVCHIWKCLSSKEKPNNAVAKTSVDVDIPYVIQKSYQKQKQKQQEAFHGPVEFNWLQWVSRYQAYSDTFALSYDRVHFN